MRLVEEIDGNRNKGCSRRYLLLTEVSDDDAHILELCNMERAEEFDDEERESEAWMVM